MIATGRVSAGPPWQDSGPQLTSLILPEHDGHCMPEACPLAHYRYNVLGIMIRSS